MKAKVDRIQYFFMIPNLVYGKAIGITAGITARKIGSDTWTAMTLGFVVGIIIVILTTYLGSKFPEKSIIQYSGELIGKWGGKLVGIILCIFFAISYTNSANVINLHLKEYLLPETPFLVMTILYALLCTYGVFLGVEVMLRFTLIGFTGISLINILMIFGTIKDFRFDNLRPMLDRGIQVNIMSSVYVASDIAMVVLGIAMLYPLINKKKKSIAVSFWGMILGFISVIIWPFMETGVMGADVMKQFVVVCMQQARSAQLTIYLPRYELLMVICFVWGVYVQSALMLYCSIECIKQVFNVGKNWYIILPLVPVLIYLTYYLGNDHNYYVKFITYPWSQICEYLIIGLPLLLFIAAALRGKVRKDKNSSNIENKSYDEKISQ